MSTLIHDPALLKLGRPFARLDPQGRSLRFANYVADLPKAPSSVNYGSKVKNWGMLANDELGDCTCAAILHMIMIWSSENGGSISFTDAQAIALYARFCGYRPGDPSTDNGGILLDILKGWRKMAVQGVTLLAYVRVNPKNWEHVKLAQWLAGSLYIGANLPKSAQTERIWQSTQDIPGGWGGHAVNSHGYAEKGGFGCAKYLEVVTWGESGKKMTPAWIAKYVDEIWFPVTTAWFNKEGKAPNGVNVSQMLADANALAAA